MFLLIQVIVNINENDLHLRFSTIIDHAISTMSTSLNRRHFLYSLAALGLVPQTSFSMNPTFQKGEFEGDSEQITLIGASWRGPKLDDTHYAGVLAANWERKTLEIRYQVALPTRPHGLVSEVGGGLLVNGVRPGTWLMRCDGKGKIVQQIDVTAESPSVRLSGHIVAGKELLYTTEIDYKNDQGRIGVRDPQSLKKLDEWASGGIEPHQALIDEAGRLLIANGGVRRSLSDKKYDLHRMDSSLVRLDGQNGHQMERWALDDPRLSMRHIAWSRSPMDGKLRLGIAMQAEHDQRTQRATAPILAVFDEEKLSTPSRENDGHGYAGDITSAWNGGFALSSNKAGIAQLWHPGQPDKLLPIVEMDEAYALTDWSGPQPGGGVLVATAVGLIRWHINAKPAFLAWPKPMALDNHWVLMS